MVEKVTAYRNANGELFITQVGAECAEHKAWLIDKLVDMAMDELSDEDNQRLEFARKFAKFVAEFPITISDYIAAYDNKCSNSFIDETRRQAEDTIDRKVRLHNFTAGNYGVYMDGHTVDTHFLDADHMLEFVKQHKHIKISCIKLVRSAFTKSGNSNVVGLKEAKDFCEMLWATEGCTREALDTTLLRMGYYAPEDCV